MGPEIFQWALGAIATGTTVIGAVKSIRRRSGQRQESYEQVSLVHAAAKCWCGREAAIYAGAEMRYVCAEHAASAVPSSGQREPDTEPLQCCVHENLVGQCRECYLDERYYQQQQQRMVAANAATIKDEEWEAMMEEEWEEDDEWEEPRPQQRRSQPQHVQRRTQSQSQSQRRPAPSQRIERPVQQRKQRGQRIQRDPRRQR